MTLQQSLRAIIMVYNSNNFLVEQYDYPTVAVTGHTDGSSGLVVQCDGATLGQQRLPPVESGVQGFVGDTVDLAMDQLGLYTEGSSLVVAQPGEDQWITFGRKIGKGQYLLQKSTEVWGPNENENTTGFLRFETVV